MGSASCGLKVATARRIPATVNWPAISAAADAAMIPLTTRLNCWQPNSLHHGEASEGQDRQNRSDGEPGPPPRHRSHNGMLISVSKTKISLKYVCASGNGMRIVGAIRKTT